MRAVSWLREGNLAGTGGLSGVGSKLPQSQPRQPVFPLAGNEEPGEEIHVLQHYVVAVRDELGPVLTVRRGHGCSHEPEVAPAVVRADEPQPVAVVDGVLVLVL